MVKQKYTVVIRTTKYLPGVDISTGKAKKEVINTKLPFDSIEYGNFLKNAILIGFSKVELAGVIKDGETDIEPAPKHIIESFDLCKPKENNPSKSIDSDHADQLEIIEKQGKQLDEQAKQIERMLGMMSTKPTLDDQLNIKEDDDEALTKAREEYREMFDGKEPDGRWKVERIYEVMNS